MTLWTKEAKEQLRLQAIASTERQLDHLQDFIDTLDIKNNETHKIVVLTLMHSIYNLQKDLVRLKEDDKCE